MRVVVAVCDGVDTTINIKYHYTVTPECLLPNHMPSSWVTSYWHHVNQPFSQTFLTVLKGFNCMALLGCKNYISMYLSIIKKHYRLSYQHIYAQIDYSMILFLYLTLLKQRNTYGCKNVNVCQHSDRRTRTHPTSTSIMYLEKVILIKAEDVIKTRQLR